VCAGAIRIAMHTRAMTLLRTFTESGVEIVIEASPADPAVFDMLSGDRGPLEVAQGALSQALDTIAGLATQVRSTMSQMGEASPTTAEFQFGLKFAAEGNVWVAKASSEAQLVVKLQWNKSDLTKHSPPT
jgi:hypothetical protein